MTGAGHKSMGLALGVAGAGAAAHYFGIPGAILWVVAAFAGASAPDWLEIRWGGATLIPHRTITHVLALWIAIIVGVSWWLLESQEFAWAALALLAFSMSALLHCLTDMGSPMGVPLVLPFRRFSIKLYTDKTEWRVILAAWLLALVSFVLTDLIVETAEYISTAAGYRNTGWFW